MSKIKNRKENNKFLYFFKKQRKLLIIVSLSILLIVLFFCSFNYIEKSFSYSSEYFFGGVDNHNPKGDFLKLILQIVGGLVIFFGTWTAFKRVKIMEQNNISDKLSNAIVQLGSNKPFVINGSIIALNQIAINNKEYKQQVFNMLSSYVRDRMKDEKAWCSLTYKEKKNYQLPLEVQSILDLFFKSKWQNYYGDSIIDLRNCKLYRANLNYADMRNAYLHGAQLQGAFLSKANLSGVDLTNVNLSSAQLHDTNLIAAELSYSFFTGADLNSTKFQFAKLRESHFEKAFLNNVNFECASLEKAIFIGCNSIDTNFNTADLSSANFSGSKLIRQHFIYSYLLGTKFYGAFIKDSNFKSAKLVSTCFNGACSKLSSQREEIDFNFYTVINQRLNKKAEFDKSVLFGKISDEEKKELIKEFKKEITHSKLINRFTKSINNPLFDGTNDIDNGLLQHEPLQNAITEFSKAIKFAGILFPK